ncbi:MAG: hypothetical protein HOV81_37520 [Kofleriaceae bacterium]|nr:hypothetical protein [Kofleriaceae bacterium]
MAARTLHVRCATWEQVEVFTQRKLRKGKLLSMKVPFAAKQGSQVTIGLELPNEVVIAIDGVIQKSAPVEVEGKTDPNRTWIEIELVGFTDEVKARLRAFQQEAPEPTTDPQIPVQPAAPQRRPLSAPITDDLPENERELFQHLSNELRRLRSAAVHEVFGVPRDAGPAVIRAAWKDLIRRNHPDLVSRRNAPAITHLAEELTILANRAYDRLRQALVSEGRGTVAGPSLQTPPGWLVGFEDISSTDASHAALRRAPNRFERPKSQPGESGFGLGASSTPSPAAAPQQQAAQGSDAFEQRARVMLAQGDANAAREVLAAALVVYPRSKPLRSLYYVASAIAAISEGEVQLATAQLETALAHHEQSAEAARLLEHIRKNGGAEPGIVQRLFR